MDNVYELGAHLNAHDDVDNVQVREGRITVAHIPKTRYAEQIPDDLFNYIIEATEGTLYQWEGEESPHYVEKHSLVGGVHNHAIAQGNPELQVHLVK